jgi:hypothetical protein
MPGKKKRESEKKEKNHNPRPRLYTYLFPLGSATFNHFLSAEVRRLTHCIVMLQQTDVFRFKSGQTNDLANAVDADFNGGENGEGILNG